MKSKMTLAAFAALLLLAAASSAVAADPILVLSLKTKQDGRVLSSVDFYNCEKDPNVKSANCTQYVTVDGKKANVPTRVLQRLDDLRRPFSYDGLSGGIRSGGGRGAMCMMAGPSQGVVLEARYLTYSPEYRIVGDEMKPVLAVARNCLFMENNAPADATAKENARAAAEILETIRDYAQGN